MSWSSEKSMGGMSVLHVEVDVMPIAFTEFFPGWILGYPKEDSECCVESGNQCEQVF
jgi:hypothetical protein